MKRFMFLAVTLAVTALALLPLVATARRADRFAPVLTAEEIGDLVYLGYSVEDFFESALRDQRSRATAKKREAAAQILPDALLGLTEEEAAAAIAAARQAVGR